ncbi:MAG: Trk system potassium transporter TrkA [Robiginitomaculum sp.]
MNIIICGAGRVGSGIARVLSAENNSVTVVDISAKLVQNITTEFDVRGVVGHGAHPSVLVQAGAETADMIIAATYSDEVNMVACQVCHSLFGTPVKIARVRSQDYLVPKWQELYSRHNMPIDIIISPEIEIGKTILRRLNTPGTNVVVPFANGLVQLIGMTIEENCPIANIPIGQIRELFSDLNVSVVGVSRNNGFITPTKEDQLTAGDEAYFVVETQHAGRLLEIMATTRKKSQQIVIIGAGNVGFYVAKELEKIRGIRVRIIELDKKRAEIVAENLKHSIVLNGDALNINIQEEASMSDAHVILSLTNDDKTNILSAMMAKSLGVDRAFSLLNDLSFLDICSSLDIDMIIDPRMTTVSSILRHVRKGRILDVYAVADGAGETIEGEVLDTSPLAGKTLREASIPDGITIGAIIRDGHVHMPLDEITIKPNDRIVLLAEKHALSHVEHFFRVSADYF